MHPEHGAMRKLWEEPHVYLSASQECRRNDVARYRIGIGSNISKEEISLEISMNPTNIRTVQCFTILFGTDYFTVYSIYGTGLPVRLIPRPFHIFFKDRDLRLDGVASCSR